jgi:hypothetical protein
MAYTHQVQINVNAANGQISSSNSYTDTGIIGIDETIPGGATVTFTNFDVDVTAVMSIVMLCDRDIVLTVNTSDATISLKAGVALIWQSDGYFYNPLCTSPSLVDVTSLKAVLASGADANLKIEVISHLTP